MQKEIKAVAYARVSSKEQAAKELSIPVQIEAIHNYCKQKSWKLVHEYINAGKSTKIDERPEFQRMIAMAKRPNRGFAASSSTKLTDSQETEITTSSICLSIKKDRINSSFYTQAS